MSLKEKKANDLSSESTSVNIAYFFPTKTRLSLIQQLLFSRKFYLVGNLQRKKKISPMHAIYLTQVVRKGENILLTTHICIV